MAKLYFRYGAMNCGKTTSLLQVAHNYEEMGQRIVLLKPQIDSKGDDKVVSRLGCSRTVDHLVPATEELTLSTIATEYRPDCILVDEAQFLTPKQIDELYLITKMDEVPVICYGLRCDFQMKGFPGATRLLEIADDIKELKTICTCGKKATQNLRLVDGVPTFEGEQVAIDGEHSTTYASKCGKCFIMKKIEYRQRRK